MSILLKREDQIQLFDDINAFIGIWKTINLIYYL